MKILRYTAIALVALLAAALFPGCAGTQETLSEVEYVIGVSQANMREPWRLVLTREIQEEAKKHPNVRLVFTDATQDSKKQISDIERLLGYGIDLLIVSPANAEEITPVVSRVYQSIPVIVLDRAVEGYDYTLFIGPDNQRIGRQAGEAVKRMAETRADERTPEEHAGIQVLEVFAESDSLATAERSAGFMEETAGNKNISVRPFALKNQLRDTAEDALLENEAALSGVDVVFAHSDDIALGVSRALKALHKDGSIRIISIDGYSGENGGLELVKKGVISQTVTCPTGGREAVRYAIEILKHVEGVPKQVILRSHSITGVSDVEGYERMRQSLPRELTRPIRVGYAQVGKESSWRLANNASIQSAAHAFHIELTAVDANQSQQRQVEAVLGFIVDRVDVIVISPVVNTGWDQVLREAKAAGIPVLLSDRNIEVPDEDMFRTFIGADFKEEGRRAMRWILKNVPASEDGRTLNIMELQGTVGATPTVERKQGFEMLLEKNAGYRIVHSESGNFTLEGGKQIVQRYLDAHEWDVDIIFAHNDDMALGAIEALEAHGLRPGRDIKIVSVDGTRAALEAIVAGKLNCSVECSPLLGPQLMKAVTDLMAGKELPLRIITDEVVFTEENAKKALPGRTY
ncbi:MAG TPA: substrate-binding domain-containing protein [Feifaniaceae bacterium]|nr:substrate-binding domain-containing protein [Feifaniaceae bacterium]